MRSPSLILHGTLFLVSLATLQADLIVVAPNGRDENQGTEASPFSTLARARDAAREFLRQGKTAEIVLRGGTYELPGPLEFSPEDSGTKESPVVWRAKEGEEVRVIGGRMITAWKKVSDPAILGQFDAAVRDQIWETDLKAQGVSEYGIIAGGFARPSSTGLELFVDDRPMSISRYPNEGYIKVTQLTGPTHFEKSEDRRKEGIFRVEDQRVVRWKNEKQPFAFGYWCLDWADQRQQIAAIDPATLEITLTEPWHEFGYSKGQYFYGFNLLCEIDHPGEWYLDRESGMLYVLPPGGQAPARAMVSVLPSIVKVTGAAHVIFQDLIFEGARDDAVVIRDSEDCVLTGCTIRNGGQLAARIEGSTLCGLRNCDISEVGGGGVHLAGGDRDTLKPCGHFVENCHIHHYARWNRTYNPAVRFEGVGCRASHNLIHDAPHQAIDFGGNDHLVEYNEIHGVCQESNDAGAIYAWNDWAGRGNIVRYNYIHHVYGRAGKGAHGVYLDDGFSGILVRGNIFEAMYRPVLSAVGATPGCSTTFSWIASSPSTSTPAG